MPVAETPTDSELLQRGPSHRAATRFSPRASQTSSPKIRRRPRARGQDADLGRERFPSGLDEDLVEDISESIDRHDVFIELCNEELGMASDLSSTPRSSFGRGYHTFSQGDETKYKRISVVSMLKSGCDSVTSGSWMLPVSVPVVASITSMRGALHSRGHLPDTNDLSPKKPMPFEALPPPIVPFFDNGRCGSKALAMSDIVLEPWQEPITDDAPSRATQPHCDMDAVTGLDNGTPMALPTVFPPILQPAPPSHPSPSKRRPCGRPRSSLGHGHGQYSSAP